MSAYGPGKSGPGAGVKLPVENGVTQLQVSPPTVPEAGGDKAKLIGFPPADRSNQNESPATKFSSAARATEKSRLLVVSPVTVTVPNEIGQIIPAQTPVVIPSRIRLNTWSMAFAWLGLGSAIAPAITPAAIKRDKTEPEEAFMSFPPFGADRASSNRARLYRCYLKLREVSSVVVNIHLTVYNSIVVSAHE